MAETRSDRGFQLIGDPQPDPAESSEVELPFGGFVLSLTTSALLKLGVSPGEDLDLSEQAEVDLAMARQTISILEMLRAKTRGNLTSEEAELLGRAIHDLKMRYVEVARSSPD